MNGYLRRSLFATTALVSLGLMPPHGKANPLDGRVVGGSATINGQNTSSVIVNQNSQRAIIDWRSFNIAPDESTRFIQPGASSVILNRVTGGLGASTINGIITANGSVYVINPDGILFGPSARINTTSFLATTHDITNSDFMAAKNAFTILGNPSASIVNEGKVSAATGGFAALVAPGVRNDGIISARLGTVALAAGNGFTLDLYGDDLIKLQPGDGIANAVRDVATGKTLKSLVENSGTLRADGGTVALSAVAARQVIDSVINTHGVVAADTIGAKAGKVIFGAATAATKAAGDPSQIVKVSGNISASGKKPGTKGGTVEITGETIELVSADIDASGEAGGGTILIGGDYHGGVPTPLMQQYGLAFQPYAVPTASSVSADANTKLDASATGNGKGGKIVVWSDGITVFTGSVKARGGLAGGDGGFAEVSGKGEVQFVGLRADLSAPQGKQGTILFDPAVENIDQPTADAISDLLSGKSTSLTDPNVSNTGADVLVAADQINVLSNIEKTAGGDATLTFRGIAVSFADNVTIGSSQGKLFVDLDMQRLTESDFAPGITAFFQTLAANGVTPQDVFNFNPSGSGPTSDLVKHYDNLLSDDFKATNFYKSMTPIVVGSNVNFYLNGGTLTVVDNASGITNYRLSAGSNSGSPDTCGFSVCGLQFVDLGTGTGIFWNTPGAPFYAMGDFTSFPPGSAEQHTVNPPTGSQITDTTGITVFAKALPSQGGGTPPDNGGGGTPPDNGGGGTPPDDGGGTPPDNGGGGSLPDNGGGSGPGGNTGGETPPPANQLSAAEQDAIRQYFGQEYAYLTESEGGMPLRYDLSAISGNDQWQLPLESAGISNMNTAFADSEEPPLLAEMASALAAFANRFYEKIALPLLAISVIQKDIDSLGPVFTKYPWDVTGIVMADVGDLAIRDAFATVGVIGGVAAGGVAGGVVGDLFCTGDGVCRSVSTLGGAGAGAVAGAYVGIKAGEAFSNTFYPANVRARKQQLMQEVGG